MTCAAPPAGKVPYEARESDTRYRFVAVPLQTIPFWALGDKIQPVHRGFTATGHCACRLSCRAGDGEAIMLGFMPRFVRRLGKATSGTTAIEYALIAALVVGVLVTAVGTMGTQVNALFQAAVSAFP
jgi:Flp pilus assembly pilin Flp